MRLHVREWGSGRPLLLINGIGAHMDMWAPMEDALPDTRLIAFDAPGTGRSQTPFLPLSIELLASLSEQLLDRLGYDRVDVLGYSFGGLIAQFLARQAPHRVRRLVLAATTPGWGGVPGSMWTLGQMSTPLRYYWRPYYESVIGGLMGGRARTDGDFVRRHGNARLVNPPSPLGYLYQLLAMSATPGTLAWLDEVAADTLVVTGDDDPIMPLGNALLLARYIPSARLFIARGEGHMLLMDDLSAIFGVMRSFLGADGVERSRAWQDATQVDDRMLQDALRLDGGLAVNPAALMSAWFRTLSPRRRAHAPARQSAPSSSSIGTPSASRTRGTIE
jgi:pimeloyl-ACP methyl ester carboxylesterase